MMDCFCALVCNHSDYSIGLKDNIAPIGLVQDPNAQFREISHFLYKRENGWHVQHFEDHFLRHVVAMATNLMGYPKVKIEQQSKTDPPYF